MSIVMSEIDVTSIECEEIEVHEVEAYAWNQCKPVLWHDTSIASDYFSIPVEQLY